MANARATANTVAQVLFSVPLNMVGKLDDIQIDNGKGTHGRIQFTIIDSFSQDVSVNNNTVNAKTAQPWTASVPQTDYFNEDKHKLEQIILLGDVTIIADQIDANVPINVRYHFE